MSSQQYFTGNYNPSDKPLPPALVRLLWNNPKYRAMSVTDQLQFATKFVTALLPKMPGFSRLSPEDQQKVIRRELILAPTLDDNDPNQTLKRMALDLLDNAPGSHAALNVNKNLLATMDSSGLAQIGRGFGDILNNIARGIGFKTPYEKNGLKNAYLRSKDYISAVEAITGESTGSALLGTIVGTVMDIATVNKLMAPLTSSAASASRAAARGMSLLEYSKALESGRRLAPVVKPALNFLAPIATETAIEAIPYYILSEIKAKGNNEPTILSKGAGAVLKTLGTNAALDFVFGTLTYGLLRTGGKWASQVLLKSEGTDKIAKAIAQGTLDEGAFSDLIHNIRAGHVPDIAYSMAEPVDLAWRQVNQRHTQALKDGSLVDAMDNPPAAVANVAIRTASPFSIETDPKTNQTVYKVFDYSPTHSRYVPKDYTDFNDVEAFYAKRIFNAMKDKPEAMAQLAEDNPLLEAFYRRGEQIAYQQSLLGELTATPSGIKLSPLSKRPIILDSEAASIVEASRKLNTFTAIPARIDLPAETLTRIAKGASTGVPPSALDKVTISNTPNVLLIGTRAAPDDLYTLAATRAQELTSKLGIPEDSIRRSILLNKGYDFYIHPDGAYEFFNSSSARFIGTANDVAAHFPKALSPSAVTDPYYIEQGAKLTATKELLKENPKLMSSAFYYTLRNGHTLENYNYLVRALVPDTIPIRTVYSTGTQISIAKLADGYELRIPRLKPMSQAGEKIFHDSFFTSLVDLIPTKKGKPSTYLLNRILKSPGSPNLLASMPANSELIYRLADKLNLPVEIGKTIELTTPNGILSFDTVEDALNYLAPRTVDVSTLRADFLRQGLHLTYNPETELYSVYSTIAKKLIGRGSLDDIITLTEYKPRRLDVAFAPTVTSINPDGTFTFTLGAKTFASSQAEAMQLLDNFQDNSRLNKYIERYRNSAGSVSETPASTYYVYSSRLNVGFDFTSPMEARRWLDTERYTLEEYQVIANKKFLDIDYTPQGYRVTAADNSYIAKTPEELENILRKYPDVENSVPEFLDSIDPQLSASIADITNEYARYARLAKHNRYHLAPEVPESGKLSPWMAFRQYTSQTENLILDTARRLKVPQLQEHYYKIKRGYTNAITDTTETAKAIRAAVTIDGKPLSRESLAKVYYSLAATSEEDAAALYNQALAKWGKSVLEPLTQQESLAASRLKEIFKALSDRFHIDAEKLLFHYMPRLRDWYNSPANRAHLSQIVLGDDLIKYSNIDLPTNMKVWFENERVEDVASYWVNDNPVELALLYSSQGFKKLHMGNAWKSFTDFAVASKLPEPVVNRMNFMRQQLMGISDAKDEKFLQSVGETIMDKLYSSKLGGTLRSKFSREDALRIGKNLYKTAYGLTYFAQIGWKPFIALKNSIDALFIQGGSRLGLPTILEAFDEIYKAGPDLFDYLKKSGVIYERSPILDDIMAPDAFLTKMQTSAFKFLANSDDLNRAVIYRAATNKFNDALILRSQGKLPTRQAFEEYIGSDMLDKSSSDWLWSKLEAGDTKTVEHEFGMRMISATQEDLSGANAPMMFRTTFLGKLFGQYGNFSAGYRARMAKLFIGNNASWQRKLAVAASIAVTTGAVWATFDALRIKTNDFMPLQPAIFTGGPGFNVMIDILRGANPNDPMSKYYRKRAWTSIKNGTIPGYTYLNKALKYAEEGNTYAVMLALMSASYKDPPQ